MKTERVLSGLDSLRSDAFARLKGRRLGLLCHAASVSHDLRHIKDLFIEAGLDLRVLFGPEHGLHGQAPDMESVGADEKRPDGPTVISLYGNSEASLHPPADALAEIDILVVDLQDVGSRYYTYATSMRYCMQACGRAGVAVVVLDRPNPLNGVTREGPILQDDFRSFVGGFRVPIRHGLTLGELARLAQAEGVQVDLSVVEMEGWSREMWFDQTGLPWVMPSPNMPSLDTATVYPGTCLVEATNLSEGRGTTRPFELIGAPWLDGVRLARDLEERRLAGVGFRPLVFQPAFHKHAGLMCGGVQIHVSDRSIFKPVECGAVLLWLARAQAPEKFAWREEAYEFVDDRPAIDLLTGSSALRAMLEAGGEISDLLSVWK